MDLIKIYQQNCEFQVTTRTDKEIRPKRKAPRKWLQPVYDLFFGLKEHSRYFLEYHAVPLREFVTVKYLDTHEMVKLFGDEDAERKAYKEKKFRLKCIDLEAEVDLLGLEETDFQIQALLIFFRQRVMENINELVREVA